MNRCGAYLLAAAIPVLSLAAHAQNAKAPTPVDKGLQELEAYCVGKPCKRDVVIALRTEKGDFKHSQPLMPPSVQPGFVAVLPGETVRAVAKFDGKKFLGWREAAAQEPADAYVVTATLEQNEGQVAMTARISQTGPSALKLDLFMLLPDSDEPVYTSSCPLRQNSSVHEMWPHPIYTLILRNARNSGIREGLCV